MVPRAACRGFVLASAAALGCVSCVHQVIHEPQFQGQPTAHVMARPPAVTAVMARQVENAIDAGEGDLQLRALRKRLAANASDVDARILLARLYAKRGLPDLALEHYRLAAAQFPDSMLVTLELAKTLRKMGEAEGALGIVRNYLANYPSGGANWELLSLEGILEDERGRFTSAETAHRAALALEPGRSALHNNLGYNLLLQGQASAAAAEFRRAIEIDPRSQIAHNNLGAALASQSHSGEALTEWRRSADPAVAHNNLAAVLMEEGRYPEARAELETALEFRHDFPAALSNLRLVAAKDGGPAAIPVAARRGSLSKRRARNDSATGTATPAAENAPEAGKK
jgi:Flp pilus assembly protein TadD